MNFNDNFPPILISFFLLVPIFLYFTLQNMSKEEESTTLFKRHSPRLPSKITNKKHSRVSNFLIKTNIFAPYP